MKATYVSPFVEVAEVETQNLMATSYVDDGLNVDIFTEGEGGDAL